MILNDASRTAYQEGSDPIDWAVYLIAAMLELRNEQEVMDPVTSDARIAVGLLLDAGWTAPDVAALRRSAP